MGIRPQKSIGWGIALKGTELRQKAAENVIEHQELSYAGLFDHLEENNNMNFHKQSPYFTKEKFSELDDDKTLFNYVEIISKNYDSDVDFEDEEWTIIFYPMVLSTLAFHDGSNEFKENSSPFVYAEIEKFFPESMTTLETVSYTIDTPPFPSEYSVVKKDKGLSNSFELLDDFTIVQEVKRCLLADTDDEYIDIFAQIAGFKGADELKENLVLAPAEEILAFAQYSGLFKNDRVPLELKPMVVYSWS